MSKLININQDLTMSSLEIVKVINSIRKSENNNTELAHSDFLKKVPEVIGEKDAGNFSSIYKDSMNREKPCYNFPKREAMLMAMSYSYSVQAAVYDAYAELESQQAPQIPQTYAAALLEAGRLALELETQTKRIDKLIHSNNSYTTSQIAKECGFKSAYELNQLLANQGLIYKQRGVWLLIAKYSGKSYQEIKQKELDNGKVIYNATWTAAGREWLLDFCERI